MDDYLAGLPEDVRMALQNLRDIIKAAVPDARERIAYKIPVYSLKRDLVGFAAQKRHCSFYTMSPGLVKDMADDLRECQISGATIHFSPEKPIPEALVVKILKARIQELKPV